MPLVLAADDVVVRDDGHQPVVVFSAGAIPTRDGSHLDRRRRMIGVVVDEIIDIIESTVTIEIEYDRPGIIGSAIIGDEPTEVVNVAYHLQRAGNDGVATTTAPTGLAWQQQSGRAIQAPWVDDELHGAEVVS
jgi:two-component system chemotaxis sensor kinase CheA